MDHRTKWLRNDLSLCWLFTKYHSCPLFFESQNTTSTIPIMIYNLLNWKIFHLSYKRRSLRICVWLRKLINTKYYKTNLDSIMLHSIDIDISYESCIWCLTSVCVWQRHMQLFSKSFQIINFNYMLMSISMFYDHSKLKKQTQCWNMKFKQWLIHKKPKAKSENSKYPIEQHRILIG